MPDQGSGSAALQKLEANGLAAASALLRLAILHLKNPIEYTGLYPLKPRPESPEGVYNLTGPH